MKTIIFLISLCFLSVVNSCKEVESIFQEKYFLVNETNGLIEIEIYDTRNDLFFKIESISSSDTISFILTGEGGVNFEFFNHFYADSVSIIFERAKYITYYCTNTKDSFICNSDDVNPLKSSSYSMVEANHFYYYITEEDYNRAIPIE
jgi:hypothetical protein